jgi:hypothetical protein
MPANWLEYSNSITHGARPNIATSTGPASNNATTVFHSPIETKKLLMQHVHE